MSAAAQRRRVHAKILNLDPKQPSIYEPNTFRYRQYLTTFNNFENNFNKNFSDGDLKGLKTVLVNFHKSFKKNELLINDISKHADGVEQNSENVFLIQRANKIVHLLVDYFLNKRNTILQNKQTNELCETLIAENQEVALTTVKILKAFSMVNPVFGKLLAHWPMFIETLLRLTLQNLKCYFKQTLRILEALIRLNSGTISKDMYPILSDLLSSLPKKYFARFSRIVALLILENSEKTNFNELSLGYFENKVNRIHSLLLSTPKFLESYVLILESLKQTIRSLTSVNSDNMSKTLTYLKESGVIKNSAVNLKILKPIFEQCKTIKRLIPEVFASEFIIKFAVSKSNITEIFFILSSLLAGRRKIDVQNQLKQFDFFNKVLEPFFEILFHPDLQLEDPEDQSNANNPLSTARIQFIRTLNNFCDRSSPDDNFRDLFITSEEKTILNNEISWSQIDFNRTGQSRLLSDKEEPKKNLFENTNTKGLLQKIINLLKKVNPDSSYHSWLCSCVGTFLRGSAQSYQVFVAHTGLLSHLLEKIVRNQITISKNIQATYDLIAEIFRFNAYNIVFLEKLCSNFGWKPTLLNNIEKNIVNSSVFLRSIILSYEKIWVKIKDNKQDQLEDQLSIFRTLTSKRDQFLTALCKVVVSETTKFENFCCVNTALTIAIFADHENILQVYFNNLIGKGSKEKEQMKNFQNTLNVWLQYYLSNTQARFSLESATSIKFVYFQDILEKIQTLCK